LVEAKGVARFGGATWRGTPVTRISVSNWLTTDVDIDRTLASLREALAEGRS
jgi:hypothetical protein